MWKIFKKEKDFREISMKRSLFTQFLLIVLVLLLCMSGSYLLINYVVRSMTRQNTERSNEKILMQIDAKTAEFHNSLYRMLTLLAYEKTAYDYFEKSSMEPFE